MAWVGAVPAVLSALAILWLPGLLALSSLRLRWVTRLALSGVVSVAAIGVAGILAEIVGLGFAAWQPALLCALLASIAWVFRRRIDHRSGAVRPPVGGDLPWWCLVFVWGVTVVGIALIAFWAVPAPDRISQTYDNVFHLSAIAHILNTGDASSLTLRTIIETDRPFAFYPAAWHSLVALIVQTSTASAPTAVNAAWIAVCAAVWLPGLAWLSQVLLPEARRNIVAAVALPLGAAFGTMPFALLTWGTLYPTFLATALLPAAVAAPLAGWNARRGAPRRAARLTLTLAAAATASAAAALGFSQPRVLVTWAVILTPFAVAEAVRSYRWARRADPKTRAMARWILCGGAVILIGCAGAGFTYLVVRLGLFTRPLDERLGGPQAQATQSVLDGLGQTLVQSWPLTLGVAPTFPAVLVAIAVLVGIIASLRRRGLRWVIVSYAILAILFALAAGSDDVFSKLVTALWYKDRFRLSSALPVLGVPLAVVGVLTTVKAARESARRVFAPAVAGLIAISAGVGLALGGVGSTVAFVYRLPARAAATEVVSASQIEFMSRIREYVPAGQRVLGDPWDGSALSQLFGGRDPVFPHVNGQWDADRLLLAARLQDVGTDPGICAALDRLRVRYILYSPHEFGGGDPSGNHFAAIHRAVESDLFVPVATDGDSTLYEIDQCGPLMPDGS